MSLEQSQGIQALLAAEKASAETINNARRRKQQRLKQAQEEAEAEVNRYKQERETQFQAWIQQNSSGSSDITAGLEKDTKTQLATIAQESDAGKQKVIDLLLEKVADVHAKPHVNYRK